MSATCPACGVAVVPGYVRCPKCQAVLPAGGRMARSTRSPGGTSLADDGEARPFPLVPVLLGAAVIAVGIAFFVTRGGSASKADAAPAPSPTETVEAPTVAVDQQPITEPTTAPAPSGPDPRAIAADLERDLKKQRLWSTVTVTGTRVDVRTSSCGDAAMGSTLDAAAGSLKGAGITKLRCVANSGTVELDRDL